MIFISIIPLTSYHKKNKFYFLVKFINFNGYWSINKKDTQAILIIFQFILWTAITQAEAGLSL